MGRAERVAACVLASVVACGLGVGALWAVLRLSGEGLLVIGQGDSTLEMVFERGVAGTAGVWDLLLGRE